MTPTDPTPVAPHRTAERVLPGAVRRHAGLVVTLVAAAAAGAAARELLSTPPPVPVPPVPRPTVSGGLPTVVGYTELPAANIRANGQWDNSLAKLRYDRPTPTDPVTRTDAMKWEALADRARNRAYDTAPPTIPHPVDTAGTANCLACHGTGLRVEGKLAPKVSHAHLTNCTQCHAEGARPEFARFETPVAGNGFAGAARAGAGGRAGPGAPPTIPHPTWMRQDCTSCHGTVARAGLRTTHPWLGNCTQCHAPSAERDQVSFPLARGNAP